MRGSIFTENIPASPANSTTMLKKGQVPIYIERYAPPKLAIRITPQRNNASLNSASIYRRRHVSRHENTMTPFFLPRIAYIINRIARGGNE